ncbi:MAG TPA: barstar family protein [Micropepsaceae bacterium]|nr:barstar family protein [Micropepsaceae bacterium]
MRVIELDACSWRTVLDFYNALLAALGAPDWHGRSVAALIDSMVYGHINAVEAPYVVKVTGTARIPTAVKDEIVSVARIFAEHQKTDVKVEFQIEP